MSNELILAISGNDIFSGGGLHADLATYTTNKQHGFVAVTCLTAMTEHGFEVIPVDPTTFAQQDRKSTRLNSSHSDRSRMPSSA